MSDESLVLSRSQEYEMWVWTVEAPTGHFWDVGPAVYMDHEEYDGFVVAERVVDGYLEWFDDYDQAFRRILSGKIVGDD